MSDVSQGTGFWQAADGKWYPPPSTAPPTERTPTVSFRDVIGEGWFGWSVLGGCLLLLLGPLLAWVRLDANTGFGGAISVQSASGLDVPLYGAGTLLIGLALAALWVVPKLTRNRHDGFDIGLLIGAGIELIGLLIVFSDLRGVARDIQFASDGSFSASAGIGLWLCLLGDLAILVPASMLGFRIVKRGQQTHAVYAATPTTASALAAASPAPSVATAPAGWHGDPTGRHRLRWWSGTNWTGEVCDAEVGTDPLSV